MPIDKLPGLPLINISLQPYAYWIEQRKIGESLRSIEVLEHIVENILLR